MINEQIRDREVRVIGEEGQQLGVMPPKEAMKLAKEANVDLVKIAPSANPPVCKLVNYGKYRYELARKEKEAKKKQKTIEIKEVRLSPNIDTNDLNTKMNAAKKFQQQVDAAAVYVNASTRFTDGGEFGYGAEIGISTQKMHARGPMGLEELTSCKYVIYGEGQVR